MFWKFNLLNSNIDTLLDKENVTLQELLDENDVLQECKAQNRKLIEFLIRPDNLEELVNLVTQEPADDQDEKVKYKYPNQACELLTSDVSDIYERLCEEPTLMGKVYSFLESEGPLNPLLASFFSKVMGLLINRKSEMILQYLQGKEDFVGQMLRHMGTSAIKDLVLRLISCITQNQVREACIQWLNEQKLIEKLINMIHPSETEDKHCNASQSLCDIIRLSRQRMTQMQEPLGSDPLLVTIQSPEALSSLLDNMFNDEKVESVVVSGLSVLQTLLEFRKHSMEGPECSPEHLSPGDAERLTEGINNTLQAITPRLKDMHALLLDPPKPHYFCMPTTVGTLDPPLGNVRLQTARLIATMLANNNTDISVELANLGTLNVLLDLYFQYIWNNFLHTQVELCLGLVLHCGIPEPDHGGEGESEDDPKPEEPTTNNVTEVESPLLPQLMAEGRLLKRVMDAWEDNDVHQSRPGGHRRGYMGHLTKIANHIVECMEKGQRLKELYQEVAEDTREKWDNFSSYTLAEVNKQNTVELVGTHLLHSSSEDDDPDFSNIPFPQDTAMQQFGGGFNEEEFAEQEERVEAPFTDRISSINFDIGSTEDNQQAATLFEQACNERMQQFDDADSDEDLWEEKEITFASASPSRPSAPERRSEVTHSDEDSEGSTDSEEELDSPVRIRQQPEVPAPSSTTENMDVDAEWTANFDDINMDATPVAMDTAGSPWESSASSTTPPAPATDNAVSSGESWANFDSISEAKPTPNNDEGWADFSSFNEVRSKPLNTTDPGVQRSLSPVAMDTADSNSNPSRTAAYMVSSAPADLATETSAVSSSTDVTPSSATEHPSTSCEDEDISSSTGSTLHSGEDSKNRNFPDQSQEEKSDSDQAEPSPPLPASPAPSVVNTHDHNTRNDLSHLDDGRFDDDADEDDDLSDNFNFLSAAGLMKSREEPSEEASPDGEASASQSSSADIEEARAKAKKALEEFDERAKPSAQNGPL